MCQRRACPTIFDQKSQFYLTQLCFHVKYRPAKHL
nr:MAG TPA: hypothetical protein [Caudoviricetes sp.]